MNKALISTLTIITLIFTACDKRTQEEKGKDAVSEKAGYLEGFGNELKESGRSAANSLSGGATEVWKGFSEGFESAPISELTITPELSNAGLTCTRLQLESKHTVNAYFIISRVLERELILTALDVDGVEIGRAKTIIRSPADEAGYADFTFDERTKMSFVKGFKLSSRPIPESLNKKETETAKSGSEEH